MTRKKNKTKQQRDSKGRFIKDTPTTNPSPPDNSHQETPVPPTPDVSFHSTITFATSPPTPNMSGTQGSPTTDKGVGSSSSGMQNPQGGEPALQGSSQDQEQISSSTSGSVEGTLAHIVQMMSILQAGQKAINDRVDTLSKKVATSPRSGSRSSSVHGSSSSTRSSHSNHSGKGKERAASPLGPPDPQGNQTERAEREGNATDTYVIPALRKPQDPKSLTPIQESPTPHPYQYQRDAKNAESGIHPEAPALYPSSQDGFDSDNGNGNGVDPQEGDRRERDVGFDVKSSHMRRGTNYSPEYVREVLEGKRNISRPLGSRSRRTPRRTHPHPHINRDEEVEPQYFGDETIDSTPPQGWEQKINKNWEASPKDFPSFDPDEDKPVSWWNSVRVIMRARESVIPSEFGRNYYRKSALSHLPGRMKGTAADDLSLLSEKELDELTNDLDAWRRFLVDNYDKEETLRRLEAFDIGWDPEVESCEKYCRRKVIALRSVEPNISESDVCSRLYERMPPEVGTWITQHNHASPSVKKIVKEAQRLDSALQRSDEIYSQLTGKRRRNQYTNSRERTDLCGHVTLPQLSVPSVRRWFSLSGRRLRGRRVFSAIHTYHKLVQDRESGTTRKASSSSDF